MSFWLLGNRMYKIHALDRIIPLQICLLNSVTHVRIVIILLSIDDGVSFLQWIFCSAVYTLWQPHLKCVCVCVGCYHMVSHLFAAVANRSWMIVVPSQIFEGGTWNWKGTIDRFK